jgi:long-chain acyl-CoA synthetase
MAVDFLLTTFAEHADREAVVWGDRSYTYGELVGFFTRWRDRLSQEAIPSGAVVSVETDFSPNAIALLLALWNRQAIVVPLTSSVDAKKPEFRAVAQVEFEVHLDEDTEGRFVRTGVVADHELVLTLKGRKHPGLVLFSSGSTGKSKGAIHDVVPLLEKFKTRRQTLRTLAFLLFDHIGGINTLLYTLSNAGCIVVAADRSPERVCQTIQDHRVELLPTSPTFLNLLLVSEAYKRYDLWSLQLVTYGTEVMPESTLRRFREALPDVRLAQTYGLSELGIMRAKSRSSDSLWVKIGGEGFQTRVVDGMLEIKAQSAMLGYLNAPSPFTDDGWFKTGDAVEVDGEYFRILGRRSEIINVGGEKVYPAEVESVLQQMDGVDDVVVRGEPSALTGQMVVAVVRLRNDETAAAFGRRLRAFCKDRLDRFKVPQKIVVTEDQVHGERFKKMRSKVAVDA